MAYTSEQKKKLIRITQALAMASEDIKKHKELRAAIEPVVNYFVIGINDEAESENNLWVNLPAKDWKRIVEAFEGLKSER